jgi:uncharacterized protein with PIN domain
MSDASDEGTGDGAATEVEAETEAETQQGVTSEDAALDLDSAAAYEQRIDELEEVVEEQNEQIERLNDLMLDLSTRVADGNDVGVCPDCNGPVTRVGRWFRTDTIECKSCGRVFHEY